MISPDTTHSICLINILLKEALTILLGNSNQLPIKVFFQTLFSKK